MIHFSRQQIMTKKSKFNIKLSSSHVSLRSTTRALNSESLLILPIRIILMGTIVVNNNCNRICSQNCLYALGWQNNQKQESTNIFTAALGKYILYLKPFLITLFTLTLNVKLSSTAEIKAICFIKIIKP